MLSLCELKRVARILDRDFAGARVERWVQPDAVRLVATLYRRDPETGEAAKRHLLLCAAEGIARASELTAPLRAAQQPPALTAYLRAHLGRARLVRVGIRDADRQLALRFEAREGDFDLVLSLFGRSGRRSNVYLLGGTPSTPAEAPGEAPLAARDILLACMRPLQETRAELALGSPYVSPSRGIPSDGEDRFTDVDDAGYLARIEAEYAGQEAGRYVSDLGRRLSKGLRKERKNAERRLAKIESELAEAEQAPLLQKQGDLLKTMLGQVQPGASAVTARDYDSGEDVVIPLDPKLSPKQNLEATFNRYRKLLRRLTKAGGRLDPARAWAAEITALADRCAELVASDATREVATELEEIAARPQIAKLLERALPRAGGPPAPADDSDSEKLPSRLQNVPRRLLPRRFRSADGLEIWVGRSDEGNDYLSTRLARGKDLFFHVDGSPGSHVILRTEGRPDPPPESVLDACELAVRFSKQRNASRVDLHVVPIHNVKKPKGAKKGLVYVTGGKTIHLRREEARLERVLASRIE